MKQEDEKFFASIEFGLMQDLKIAREYFDITKINFIEGQLKMLNQIRNYFNKTKIKFKEFEIK